jgi:hypothetical protein
MEDEPQDQKPSLWAPEGLRQPNYLRRSASKIKQNGQMILKWARPEWVKRKSPRKRGKELLEQDARESRSGVHTFLTMAHFAIDRAVDTEPNVQVRRQKVRQMRKVWRDYQRDLMGVTRR